MIFEFFLPIIELDEFLQKALEGAYAMEKILNKEK